MTTARQPDLMQLDDAAFAARIDAVRRRVPQPPPVPGQRLQPYVRDFDDTLPSMPVRLDEAQRCTSCARGACRSPDACRRPEPADERFGALAAFGCWPVRVSALLVALVFTLWLAGS